jgi:two-component system response regulator AtoC
MERAVVLNKEKTIKGDQLYLDGPKGANINKTLHEMERELISEALQNNNQTKAAETLGITVKELRDKLQAYKLK